MSEEPKVTRKLSAILSADVKGYSLLMAEDEAYTIKTLKAYRQIMSDLIGQHNGRVVDFPGDNVLAEFASAVNAVQCAVEIQKQLKIENDSNAKTKSLHFRIGVNIGDVVQDGDRIYGSGVNVAARIEGLAEPGGICISRNAYDHIKDKLKFGYEYLGDHEVKNIKDPVRVYKVLMDTEDEGKLIGEKQASSTKKWTLLAVIVAALVLLLIIWQFYQTEPEPTGKPSIVVLPFENMSGDPEQEYFSDGMTDELIGDLAKIENILVISRNSAFTYKSKPVKVQEIAKDLNVKYVLEGSVQKSGNRVRIRAQLIDGKTDHHIWSESYDGDSTIDKVFELQDQITNKIVSALAIKLSKSEKQIIADKGTSNIDAYNSYLKGMGYMRRFTPDDYIEAISYFKQSIELDQNFSQAYAALAYTYWSTFAGGKRFWDKIGIDYLMSRILARHYLELAMEKPSSMGYQLMAIMEVFRRRFKEAIDFAEKAVSISPNDADALYYLGTVMIYADNSEEGIKYIKKAVMQDPMFKTTIPIGVGYFSLGDYEKTVKYINLGLADNPERIPFLIYTAAAHGFLGNELEAKKALEEWLMGFSSGYPSVQWLYYIYPFKNLAVFDRLLEGLIKAGYKADSSDYYRLDEANKLKGQEISKLLFGKTQTGDFMGFQWSITRDKYGEAQYPSPWGEVDQGKSWIEGDAIYSQFKRRYNGIQYGCNIYSNPEGNDKTKSEYLSVCDFGIIPFSVEE